MAIDLVVAWRVYHLVMSGRETPNVPCTVYFDEDQWKALVAFVHREVREVAPTLGEALRMVAGLGGFLGRKSDGHPGPKSVWLGLQRLDDITYGWTTAIEMVRSGKVAVSSKHDYG